MKTRLSKALGGWAAVAWFVLAATSCGPPSTSKKAKRPNLIIISIDTLRADHLGAYGNPRDTSPAVDWLAKIGVLFENAYSQAPKTAPSHMSLFTGLYPESHGVSNWGEGQNRRLSEEIPTLATLLKNEGYRTRAFTGYGHMRPDLGFDQGFETYVCGGDVVRIFAQAIDSLRRLTHSELPTSNPESSPKPEERDPFFLFIHTYEIHDPYVAPYAYLPSFVDPNYKGEIISTRSELAEEVGTDWNKQHELYWSRVNQETPADVDHLKNLYDAAIRFTDGEISRLAHTLLELGILEETIIVFLSDHGEEFQDHGGFLHETLYQEILHVPLLIKFSGEKARELQGTRIADTARLIDVLPTLLDELGLPIPEHLQGRSLLPLLGNRNLESRPVISQWTHEKFHAIRDGDWKYIRREVDDGIREELFDLGSDPQETSNLLEARSPEAEKLRGMLSDLREQNSELHRRMGSGISVPLDKKTRKELEALGYLTPEPSAENAKPRKSTSPETDPKKKTRGQ